MPRSSLGAVQWPGASVASEGRHLQDVERRPGARASSAETLRGPGTLALGHSTCHLAPGTCEGVKSGAI